MSNERVNELISQLRKRLRPVNMREMRVNWSKLLNDKEKILVVTNRGKIVGFYIGIEASKDIPKEYRMLFMHMINVYGEKMLSELKSDTEVKKDESTKVAGSLR